MYKRQSTASLISNDSVGDFDALLRCHGKEEQVHQMISLCQKNLRRVVQSSSFFDDNFHEIEEIEQDLSFSKIQNDEGE